MTKTDLEIIKGASPELWHLKILVDYYKDLDTPQIIRVDGNVFRLVSMDSINIISNDIIKMAKAINLALEKCSFPIGAMKAKEALKNTIKVKEQP